MNMKISLIDSEMLDKALKLLNSALDAVEVQDRATTLSQLEEALNILDAHVAKVIL